MKNNNNTTQKQIDKINYENHIRRQLLRIENNTTQVLDGHIKTSDIGLVALVLLNRYELKEIADEKGVWLIKKDKKTEDLYIKYKNKEATTIEVLTYARTLTNLIIKDIEKLCVA